MNLALVIQSSTREKLLSLKEVLNGYYDWGPTGNHSHLQSLLAYPIPACSGLTPGEKGRLPLGQIEHVKQDPERTNKTTLIRFFFAGRTN